jgi:hypothetical protein
MKRYHRLGEEIAKPRIQRKSYGHNGYKILKPQQSLNKWPN